jgi:hypothetical protein
MMMRKNEKHVNHQRAEGKCKKQGRAKEVVEACDDLNIYTTH